MKRVLMTLTAGLMFLAIIMFGSPAHATVVQQAESHTKVTVAYPRQGEGLISLTARTCGSSVTWTEVATLNRVYGPAFVIFYGRGYQVPCARVSTTASRSTARTSAPISGWTHPLPGTRCTSGWGAPRVGHTHKGLDFPRPSGTQIHSAAAGYVKLKRWSNTAGYYVMINHGRYQSVYMHLRSPSFLRTGTRVAKGQTIAYVGATGNAHGPHLHFEIHAGAWNPIPPAAFMRARGVRIVGC